MNKPYIIANWKSNKTLEEAKAWVTVFSQQQLPADTEVIICPPFTLLSWMKEQVAALQLPIKLGAQTLSSYSVGSYTGEINATQLKEFVEYVIIGHSERRTYQKETTDDIALKVTQARTLSLLPVLCVQDELTPIPEGVEIVAYEPLSAIGTGTPDSPENAERVALALKQNPQIKYVLYGGSVTAESVAQFNAVEALDGYLVGKASLDPSSFITLIQNA